VRTRHLVVAAVIVSLAAIEYSAAKQFPLIGSSARAAGPGGVAGAAAPSPSRPPVYDVTHLRGGWIAVSGTSMLAMRVPSMVAMSLTAGAIVLLGRRLVNVETGLVAGLIFAGTPAVSRYAQEIRSYALVTLCTAVATILLLRALDRPSRGRWIWYGVFMVLLGLGHFVALTVVAPHALYVYLSARRDERRIYPFAATIGGVLLAVIPLPALASHQSSAISWIKSDLATAEAYPGKVFLSARLACVIIPLALLGVLALRRRWPAGAMLALWAAGPPVLTYATAHWLHLFSPRYVLFTLPAWALLAGAAVCSVGRLFSRRAPRALWVLGAVVAVPAVMYLGYPDQLAVRHSPVDGQPSYRAALTYVLGHQQPGDGIAYNDHVGGRSDLARAAAEYEWRDLRAPRDVFLATPAAVVGHFGAVECTDAVACLGNTGRLWLVTTTDAADPRSGMATPQAAALRGFAIRDSHRFPGVRVVLLVRPSG
jgi:mannosyltransferase